MGDIDIAVEQIVVFLKAGLCEQIARDNHSREGRRTDNMYRAAANVARLAEHGARGVKAVNAYNLGSESYEHILDSTLDRLGVDLDVEIRAADLYVAAGGVILDIEMIFGGTREVGSLSHVGVGVFARACELLACVICTFDGPCEALGAAVDHEIALLGQLVTLECKAV